MIITFAIIIQTKHCHYRLPLMSLAIHHLFPATIVRPGKHRLDLFEFRRASPHPSIAPTINVEPVTKIPTVSHKVCSLNTQTQLHVRFPYAAPSYTIVQRFSLNNCCSLDNNSRSYETGVINTVIRTVLSRF